MIFLLRAIFLFLLINLPFVGNAADLPTVVEGAESYNKADCISSNANDCIQSICLTSSDTDCQEKCHTSAVDKCKALSE